MDLEAFTTGNGIDTKDMPDCLAELGIGAYERYMQTGSRDDINKAIDWAKKDIDLANDSDPSHTQGSNNLGVFLDSRYERIGETKDLEAIETAKQAIELTPDDKQNLAGRLNNLGVFLSSRYEQTGEMRDLEEAIQAARQATEAMPKGHPDLADFLHNLRIMLKKLYDRTGEMRDLEDAIQVARQAIKLTPDGHPGLAGRLHNLGIKLGRRYDRIGETKDLEEAIETAKQAIELTPDDSQDLADRLDNFGIFLSSRYERTGQMRDLEEAIQVARQAIEAMPNDHPALATCLHNLGNNLESWYKRTGEVRYLKDAIHVARQAVESTPNDHRHRVAYLDNLGNKLETRHERTGEIRDLQEAMQVAIQAIELTPDDHPGLAGRLHNLGIKLDSWYEGTGDVTCQEDAIQLARQAIKLTPDGHPGLAGRLNNLGNKLNRHYKRTGEIKHLHEASAYLFEAWSCSNAVPFYRVTAAARCLELLAQQHEVDQGIDLGRQVLNLLPSVHTRALDRNDQQFVMSTFAGVASDLCGLLLSANRLTEALECLEQGRAIIIGQLLDDRSDLSLLRRDHSQLAKRYENLVDEVNAPIRQTTLGVVEALSVKRRQEAAAELDMCLKEIRRVPGHERFMLGQTVAEMQECVTEGSIVVINITDCRSDAIIISHDLLRTIELPELSASKAWSWVSQDWSTKKKSEQRKKNDEFLDYLSWLWHACVKHIVAEISDSQVHQSQSQSLPRVWWIGCGLASSMPFHAAGVHRRGSNENAYCRMISSYTPSIKALGYAQKQAKRAQEALVAQDASEMLIAVMPTSPKGPNNKKAPKNLRGVEEEMREILNLTRSHMRTTVHTHPSVDAYDSSYTSQRGSSHRGPQDLPYRTLCMPRNVGLLRSFQ
ncbi:hypothetical protein F53441_8069 [Fusarium austroafricanum]|uniref:MalT-like TPR region domain-containing protein n=1 Tax=Fusarium austroafricanum TaxID=2364996 RepID=A0A8H4P534_9HYPO|nr:hypothetical protein F53441_8069 [Fusarium austroafricanum]